MYIWHIHIFNSKRIEITVHKSSCEIELILRKVNCNSTKLIPLIKYRSKPANNLYNVQDDRRKETSLPFIFLVVPSISFAYNPFVDKTLLPLSTSSRLVDESPRLRSRGVMNENMYSLSWRPGESSARTLRSSAFVNEPIHTHTQTSCSMMYATSSGTCWTTFCHVNANCFFRWGGGEGVGRRATTAGGGQSSSYSLSLSLFFVSIAELFSSMKGLG